MSRPAPTEFVLPLGHALSRKRPVDVVVARRGGVAGDRGPTLGGPICVQENTASGAQAVRAVGGRADAEEAAVGLISGVRALGENDRRREEFAYRPLGRLRKVGNDLREARGA